MATAKLVPGKPTVTIEGLSYEAAQAVKVWLYSSVMGSGKVKQELIELLDSKSFGQIKLPDSLDQLHLSFDSVDKEETFFPNESERPF